MNIFEYDLNSLDIEEVARLFEIFKEIPEEEFKAKFKTKIDEICFGEYRCQD